MLEGESGWGRQGARPSGMWRGRESPGVARHPLLSGRGLPKCGSGSTPQASCTCACPCAEQTEVPSMSLC